MYNSDKQKAFEAATKKRIMKECRERSEKSGMTVEQCLIRYNEYPRFCSELLDLYFPYKEVE